MPRQPDNSQKPKGLKRAINFISRWTWRVFGTLVIASALFVLLAQTEFFRTWLRDRIIAIANAELIGKLQIDDARLDIFRGIVLVHPRLYAEGTTVLQADEITVSYDVAALWSRTFAVSELTIKNPTIKLIRSEGGVWNFTRIVKPNPDTTSTEPPDLSITIRALKIDNGTLFVNDRTTAVDTSDTFDPTHLRLTDLQLNLSIRAALRARDYAAAINGMSFTNKSGRVNVEGLTSVIRATRSGVDIQSLKLKTQRSEIWLRARLNDVDLTQGFSDSLFRSHPLMARVEIDSLWGPDLQYFIPDVNLADGYALTADVKFNGRDLDVSGLHLVAGDADVKGSVLITDLDGIKPIGIDIHVNNSHARYADVRRRLKFVELPELPFLGTTTLNNVHMRGHPDDSLWFKVDGSERVGQFNGSMTLYLSKPTLGYEVDMNFKNGDLSKFNDDPSLVTSLNGRVMMVGDGVTLQELNGTTQIELDRSRLFGRPIRTFRTMIKANGKGDILVDTLFADVTPFRDDTTQADPFDEISSQRLGLHAEVHVADPDHTKYKGQLNINGLDVASLFDTPTLPSRLSWRSDFDLEGIDIDSVVGQFKGHVYELMLADRSMMPFHVEITSENQAELRRLTINSDFASGKIEGKFLPSTFTNAIITSVDAVAKTISQRTAHLLNDTVIADPTMRRLQDIDARIVLHIPDISPINMILPDVLLSGSTNVAGRVTVNSNAISINMDTIVAKDASVTQEGFSLTADPTYAAVVVEIDQLQSTPHLRRLNVTAQCDSILRINDDRIVKPNLVFSDENSSVAFVASAGLNNMKFGVKASGTVEPQAIDLAIDSASYTLDAKKGLMWKLTKPSHVNISKGVFEVSDMLVQRGWGEQVSISGVASKESFQNFTIGVTNFPLRDIPLFVELDGDHPIRLMNGLVTNLGVVINGTWEQPAIDVKMDAVDVSYNGALIGKLRSQFRHDDRSITGTLNVFDQAKDSTKGTLALTVAALPLDLAFTDVENRMIPGKPVDIELEANGLAMAAIEPFLPAIERLQGKADATITVKGTTPDDIKLGGSGTFKKARFLASSTNVEYLAEGSMHLDGQTLYLDTITVRNTERDLKGGIARAEGQIFFSGLSVDSIDFQVATPTRTGIKVLNSASQARSPDIYGDLVICSGAAPIHFFGHLDSPKLRGDIIVNYSDIVFPQERSSTRARQTSFSYLSKDSAQKRSKSLSDFQKKKSVPQVDTADTTKLVEPIPDVAQAIREVIHASAPSFSDIIEYDLKIYLRGRTLLTMILGMFEMLIADLEQTDPNQPLTFKGKFADNSTNLGGVVRVKYGASTYKFYKPFRTSGTLNFNAGGMTNPGLDLKAVYEDARTVTKGGDTKREEYKVELSITGTKQYPKIAYRVWRNNREVVGDSTKIAGDALMLILVGRTQDELYAEGQGNLVNEVNAAFSAVATNALADVIGNNGGIVQSAQLDVGADISQSRLTVSGQILGDVSYRVSGQISDFTGNSTFTLSIPFSVLADEEALRYLQMDFSHTVNNSGNVTRQTRLWEIKLGARLP